ncbi:MAG: hypothetical protein CMJ64_16920 [Planctomycetaceae bacterium]|nr:hypothetical protein [Planctomycetaceae bacterium]
MSRFISIAVICLLQPVLGNSVRAEPIVEPLITAGDRDHWSFRPLERPALPTPTNDEWCRNPIDRFILAKRQEKQLASQPEADRPTLIRRLSFDLLGLPPTPAEIDAFEDDRAPNAYERLVDRLLNSHHYGERWAQHWLDLARFAETDGFEHDKVRSEAWKYRDWVIDALNADMPYSRFVAWQLAGDELSATGQPHIATTFCLSGPDMPDINSQEERRQNVMNELTGTVGSVLLGLQFGCAQCHDHKYDPISQADFYRLRAIFEPAVHVTKNQSLSVLKGNDKVPASYLMIRGDWRRRGPEVHPAFPRIVNPSQDTVKANTPTPSTGRRTALASWIAQANNPLPARVIANRVWQYHFGDGLSRTPSDFGTIGDEPTHPKLLDWLARELIENDWSLKHLHRLIVTSATYRQSSSIPQSAIRNPQSIDPGNLWLSRFPRRRLSGEAVRDAMFAASGSLSTARGGRGVMPPLPEELLKTLLKNQWKVNERESDHYRRSIYLFCRRNLRYPIFDAFDRPDGNASCPRRSESTTASQALLLLNSAFSFDAAQRLAGTLLATDPHINDDTLRDLFRRVVARQPTDEELRTVEDFRAQQTKLLIDESRSGAELALPCPTDIDPVAAAALTHICLALFNSNEFLYID